MVLYVLPSLSTCYPQRLHVLTVELARINIFAMGGTFRKTCSRRPDSCKEKRKFCHTSLKRLIRRDIDDWIFSAISNFWGSFLYEHVKSKRVLLYLASMAKPTHLGRHCTDIQPPALHCISVLESCRSNIPVEIRERCVTSPYVMFCWFVSITLDLTHGF